MIQDSSLEIYLKRVYPNLTNRQRPVLHHLRNASVALTNAEIAAALGLPINQITPRILELREQGLVIDAGRRKCRITGNNAHAWRAKYPVLPPAREEKSEPSKGQLGSLGI
jgi:biotin operon repressor